MAVRVPSRDLGIPLRAISALNISLRCGHRASPQSQQLREGNQATGGGVFRACGRRRHRCGCGAPPQSQQLRSRSRPPAPPCTDSRDLSLALRPKMGPLSPAILAHSGMLEPARLFFAALVAYRRLPLPLRLERRTSARLTRFREAYPCWGGYPIPPIYLRRGSRVVWKWVVL